MKKTNPTRPYHTTVRHVGCLFRRRLGKYIPLDGDPDATIYFRVQKYGTKRTWCLFTTSRTVALRLVSADRASLNVGNYTRYLKKLVDRGRRAEKELHALLLGEKRK